MHPRLFSYKDRNLETQDSKEMAGRCMSSLACRKCDSSLIRQDDAAYAYYDSMTARELFRRAGVSARLYREFLEPILLVTLFAPGEQLSGESSANPSSEACLLPSFYISSHL
jgi:uncharacterized protein with NAD-binding domain and iron-sulfur cluster